MGFAWSHTTYAEWNGIIFNFEWKRDLDYFLDNAEGAKRVSAVEAWDKIHGTNKDFIRVRASSCLGSNSERRQRINMWYQAKKGAR